MRRDRYYIIAVLLAILPMLASCRQELCYDHFPAIDLKFAWEQEWERDYGHNHVSTWDALYHGYEYDDLRPTIPEWVNVIRYFEDGAPLEKYLSPEGLKFEVEEERECSMLLYNGDTEYIVLSDVASLTKARAAASSRSRAGSSLEAIYSVHEGARTTNPPDILYAAFIENIPGIKSHNIHQLTVKMQPLVYSYLIRFDFEEGLEYVALARGALGGMAESVYLRTGVTSEESSIILFDCEIKSGCCQSHVRSFGIPGFPDVYYGRSGSHDRKFTLNLEVRLKNGETKEFNYDVTDQVKKQPRGGVITITGLKIEKPAGGIQDGGFEVDVTDWEDVGVSVPIPIGGQGDT